MSYNYMHVIATTREAVAIRVPYPYPVKWRALVQALTPVAHEQGIKAREIFALEGIVPRHTADRVADDVARAALMDDAFSTGSAAALAGFALYDWRDGVFVRVRGPVQK